MSREPLSPYTPPTPEANALPPRAWLVVGLLWVVACLNYLDRVILVTMRTSITAAIPMSDTQFALLSTVFLAAYACCSPLGGFVADRFSRSRIILFSLLVWSAATWLTAHASSLGELLCCRAVMGLGEACYFPTAWALLMDYHPQGTRSLANGIHLSGVTVGSGLGGIGGWLADRQDWTFVFQLFGAVGLVYSLVLLCLLRDAPRRAAADATPAAAPRVRLSEALVSLFSQKTFIVALLFWGMLGIASWAFIGWLPSYLHEQFHLSQGRAGLLALGCIYSASLLGMIFGGAWADRWTREHPRGRVWVSVIGLLVTVPAVLVVANTTVLALALAGLVVYGFTRSFPDANMVPILCQVVDPRYRATAFGLMNTFAVLAGGATIYLGGALRDASVNVSSVFDAGAASLFACAVLVWFINAQRRASAPEV